MANSRQLKYAGTVYSKINPNFEWQIIKPETKYIRSVRIKRYRPMVKTVDGKGRLLTYLVYHNGFWFEYNTLSEARIMASVI